MFIELIATIMAGLASAGVVLLINRFTGGRLPRWTVPVIAGAAMLGTTVSNEYTWFSRTASGLPEDMVVAHTVENRAFYRPWTYLKPYTNRFVAVDAASLRTHPDQPGQRMAELFFFGRWAPVRSVPVLVDCTAGARAALIDAMRFDETGAVENADWTRVGPSDPVVSTVCGV